MVVESFQTLRVNDRNIKESSVVKNLEVALLCTFPAMSLQMSLAGAFCHRSAKSTINHSPLSSDSVDWTNTPHPAERREGVGAGVETVGWHFTPRTGVGHIRPQ